MSAEEDINNVFNELDDLKQSLYDLSARNPFINVQISKLCFDEKDLNSVSKIYQKAQFFEKEYGLDATLKIHSFLKWKDPIKGTYFISPFLVESVKINKRRKLENEFYFEGENLPFINPILLFSLKRFYDIDLSETENPHEQFLTQLNTRSESIITVDDFTENEEWQLIIKVAWGNFNYKKSLLGQDFDAIKRAPSSAIISLLDGTSVDFQEQLQLNPILPTDSSQRDALLKALNSNFVIQGPPGTGKSHSIVNLISSFLSADKKVLFVSQKKSALDVVYNSLKSEGLGSLTSYFNAQKDEKKTFFKELRTCWEELQKNATPQSNVKEDSFVLLDYFQNKLAVQNPVLHELVKSDFRKQDLVYEGIIPKLENWKKQFDGLLKLEAKIIQVSDGKCQLHDIIILNKAIFSELKPLVVLEKRLADLLQSLVQVEKYKSEKRKTLTQKCLAASVLGMVNKTQLDLLNVDSKRFKSFSTWAKKYQLTAAKLKRQEQHNKKWVNKPSKSEITELIDLLKHQHAPKGIFGLLRRRSERIDHAFKGFDANLSSIGKQQLLEELRSEWNLKSELTEIEIKLKHNFNVLHPETEIDSILAIRNKLDQVNVTAYTEILEADNSGQLIQDLATLHPIIQQINHLAKFTFHEDDSLDFSELESRLEQIRQILPTLRLVFDELSHFYQADAVLRSFVLNHKEDVLKLNSIVLYHHLIQENRFEDGFSKINGEALLTEIKSRNKNKKSTYRSAASTIKSKVERELKAVEELIATPASKLSNEEKELKKLFKAQKKLLIHEITKKQQHVAVKEFSSICWDLLSKIQKVWVMNPLAVSERLACEKELFDVVIFDEASQIPLEDAIPTIYRAKQVVVVGDDKQMPPSSFFSSSTETPTLLDKASISYPKEMFKWHYRSQHPGLIQFSNHQFYEDELLTFPSNNAIFPVEFKYVKGVFNEGSNLIEAKEIAAYVSAKSDLKNLGIVAFSKEQEKTITKALLDLKIDITGLMIRNLENVQGVERDEIIISIGYAKNAEGIFRMNFGPVNQESGPNRLNVLFSRAKKKMTVFSSVTAADFILSDNPGVTCLTDFLSYAENNSTNEEASPARSSKFPFGLELPKGILCLSTKDGNGISCWVNENRTKVLLLDPGVEEGRVEDICTIVAVLSERFKEVKIMLTLDYWNNPERFINELEIFFK